MAQSLSRMAPRRESRPEAIPPLVDLLVRGDKEAWLIKLVESGRLKEEHRTAAPWSITTQREYLEASRPVDGYTPLHIAAGLDFSKLCECMVRGGARVDLLDNQGRTALMIAATRGRRESVKALLRVRAAVDYRDNSGKQAMHHAISLVETAGPIVEELLKARAGLNVRDTFGLTPLMVAAASQATACAVVLALHGAAPLGFDREHRTILELAHGTRKASEWMRPATAPGTMSSTGRSALAAGAAATMPGAVQEEVPARKRYPRWDGRGDTSTQSVLLFEERTFRRKAVPLLAVSEQHRLKAALPLLC
mmetsp:Transcript_99659/g.280142  ORF Transcript_99659/g.280142 Transcript_99659/m.280142 type:complete len:308 (-) Transcript_99659:194-1117(-)